MHVADREHPARLPHREEDPRALAVQMVVEVAAVPAGEAVRERLAVGGDADDADHRPAGNGPRSFMRISPSRTSKIRVSGARTCSISWPKPGMSVATPHSIGRTSRISATSESPGSAPFTATGPVALLIRDKSISVTRSSSERIWPVKQSFVSKVTVSPGSTSSTGSRSGPNDQITWSREIRCVVATADYATSSGSAFVLDVDAVDIGEPLRRAHHEEDGDEHAGGRPPMPAYQLPYLNG